MGRGAAESAEPSPQSQAPRSGGLWVAQTDVQFTQLLVIHCRRCLSQQTLCPLRLGEGDHISNAFGTRHECHDSVKTKGQATMRGRTVLKGIQQEAKLQLCLFRRDAQGIKSLLLHARLVDTHRATADLPAVDHHVIGF